MFVMVAGRAQGKSVTALRWLLEQPGHRMLIVANVDMKHHLLRTASQMIPNSIPAEEFLKRYVSPNIVIADRIERMHHVGRGREIGIDDAEEVLKIMLGGRVEFAAFNATLVPVVSTPAQSPWIPYTDANTGERGHVKVGTVDGIRPHRYPVTQAEHDANRRLAIQASPNTVDAEILNHDC